MSYCIEYPGKAIQWNPGRIRWKCVFCYGGLCFGLFVFAVSLFWKEGRSVLMEWLYPGDPVVTRHALIHLTGRLRAGETFGEAALFFCREILGGA